MNLIAAILIGLFFGFVLQKSGAANPQRIINMLRLRDVHLMKAIFTGIGLSSLLLFILLELGLANPGHLSVKTAHLGVVIGGAVMGLGWAISGFCPGTGLVAAGALRKDALFYIFGGLVGALLFTLLYGALESAPIFDALAGEKATLAETGIKKNSTLIPSLPAAAVAGTIGGAFILIACFLPKRSPSE
jgi:uncharacterized membrane protein YedE/YeeE